MKNNNTILSINIPTYNRPKQIQKQVRRILPQLNDLIRLTVYDNCSDYTVSDLFTEEERKLFTINRNPINIGGDANIARCFEKCETEWLWTLSDDDYILPDSINKILEYILNNDDYLFINIGSPKTEKTTNFLEFSKIMSDCGVFTAAFSMSACIYNWEKLKNDIQHYYKYLSAMLGTLIMITKNIERTNNKCLFINGSYIEFGTDVGWNYSDYIYSSSLILRAFKDNKKKDVKYKKTILLGYHKTNYKLIEINRKSSNINYWERLSLLIKATKLQGLINAFIYCPKEWFNAFIYSLIGLDSISVNSKLNTIKNHFLHYFSMLKNINTKF